MVTVIIVIDVVNVSIGLVSRDCEFLVHVDTPASDKP